MKSMDFNVLDVAIITRSRLQTIGKLIPPQKWTFPKRFKNFETYFRALAGCGRSFLTGENTSHHKSQRNRRKTMISKDFGEIHGFQGTRSSDYHEITASDYWTVGSTPEIDFSQAFEKV